MKMDVDQTPSALDDDSFQDVLPPPGSSADGDEEDPMGEHDQLPTPEEYKAKMRDEGGVGRVSSASDKSKAGILTFVGLLVFVIIITAIAVPLALNNQKKQNPYEGESQMNTGINTNENKGYMYEDDDDNDDGFVDPSPTHPPANVMAPNSAPVQASLPVASPVASPVSSPVSSSSSSSTSTSNSDRLGKTISYLVKSGAAKQEDLDDADSPQGAAAYWLAVDDGFAIEVPSVPEMAETRTRFIERWALAVFYFSTNGSKWRYQLQFMQPIDHCDWYETFIDTSGSIIRMGVTQCEELGQGFGDRNEDEMVARIDLSNNGMSGTIPSEIQYLQRMETMIIPFNPNLKGKSSLSGLAKIPLLKHLELQYNGLSGTIPDDFGSLTSLTFLGLGNNLMTGAIPDSFFTKLSNLNVLGIDDNLFESPIAPFANFLNMEKLYAEDNLITGQVTPALINIGWQKMVDLDLSANKLEGPIPSNIWSMPNLEVLDLHKNMFVGPIPDIDSQHEKLTYVSLQNNTLDWRIPEGIHKLVNLAHLDVSLNNLVGPFPTLMNELTKLQSLYAGSNQFSENTIPNFFEELTNLRELSLKQNKVTGTIPTFIGKLSLLRVLDLDSNQLKGSIPSEMGLLTGLNTLMLNRNELTGTIPETLSSMSNLGVLLLDKNELTGTADPICATPTINTTFFSADCADPGEIQCSCCNLCCSDSNTTCNNFDWHINLDGIWEYDFQRVVYQFSQNLVPSDQQP